MTALQHAGPAGSWSPSVAVDVQPREPVVRLFTSRDRLTFWTACGAFLGYPARNALWSRILHPADLAARRPIESEAAEHLDTHERRITP